MPRGWGRQPRRAEAYKKQGACNHPCSKRNFRIVILSLYPESEASGFLWKVDFAISTYVATVNYSAASFTCNSFIHIEYSINAG